MHAVITWMRRLRADADQLLDRVGRRRLLVSLLAVVIVVLGVTAGYQLTREGSYRITARFVATPGLYADNDVDILGVPTGHVESVTPHQGWVDVVISLPDHVKIPTDAKAVLMAPNPVSDRFVELTPAWTAGMPVMRHGYVLDRSRTYVPLELDQIYSSLATLSTALGPHGANAKGDLSAALHAFATLVNGNGKDVNTAIQSIAAALPALTRNPDDLKNLITGLDSLTTTLVSRNSTINSLYGDLATATGQLSDERTTLATAIANLQRGLAQVSTFLQTNKGHIVGSVSKLNTVLATVLANQRALIKTFDTAPLGFTNFNRAIDPNGPCLSKTASPHDCEVLWARVDLTKDAASFIKVYCGDTVLYSLLPIFAKNAGLGQASATDTACGAETGLLQNRTGPSGSPKTPDLDLTHYLAR